MAVFVVPGIIWLLLILQYLARRAAGDADEAKAHLYNQGFFALFITYPFITNKLFKMLDCRKFDDQQSFIASDYNVSCDTALYDTFSLIAVAMI
eukprot:COSAG01_NODE_31144_length_603_cov_0.585317_2_plen_93_part_01